MRATAVTERATADATQRYLGWGRLAAGTALLVSLLAEVLRGEPWFTTLVLTGGVLLVVMGLATSNAEVLRRLRASPVLDGMETAVFGALLAGGVDEDVGYVVALGLLMLVLAALRGRRHLRLAAGVAVVAEVTRQLLGLLVDEAIAPEDSLIGLGLSLAVSVVVAQMVDRARESERAARTSEAAAGEALAEAERAIGQLEAMHRVVASGIGRGEDETTDRIVREIASSVGVPFVSTILLDEAGRPRVSATTEPEVVDRDDIDPLAPGPFRRGPLARALTGRPARASEAELMEHASTVARRGDGVVHPLMRANGAVIGALVCSVPDGRTIDENVFRTLGRLAAQTSLAIESARALDREAELAERYRELDRMKTDFIAITSHELRTPLTTVMGVVEVLHRRFEDLGSADREQLLAALRRQTHRLGRLVDDLRTVSIVDAGTLAVHVRPSDVDATIRETASALAEIDTTVEIDAPLPRVVADPDRLAQVLTNLLINGGQHGTPPVHVEVTADTEVVTVRVWDEGPGIPPERRDAVFQRFVRLGETQAHSRGSGLGLFIARELTEAMGGTITVVDHPSGSAFELTLPVCPSDQ